MESKKYKINDVSRKGVDNRVWRLLNHCETTFDRLRANGYDLIGESYALGDGRSLGMQLCYRDHSYSKSLAFAEVEHEHNSGESPSILLRAPNQEIIQRAIEALTNGVREIELEELVEAPA